MMISTTGFFEDPIFAPEISMAWRVQPAPTTQLTLPWLNDFQLYGQCTFDLTIY